MKLLGFRSTRLSFFAQAVLRDAYPHECTIPRALAAAAASLLTEGEVLVHLSSPMAVEYPICASDSCGLSARLLGVWVPNEYEGPCTTEAGLLRNAAVLRAERRGFMTGISVFVFGTFLLAVVNSQFPLGGWSIGALFMSIMLVAVMSGCMVRYRLLRFWTRVLDL